MPVHCQLLFTSFLSFITSPLYHVPHLIRKWLTSVVYILLHWWLISWGKTLLQVIMIKHQGKAIFLILRITMPTISSHPSQMNNSYAPPTELMPLYFCLFLPQTLLVSSFFHQLISLYPMFHISLEIAWHLWPLHLYIRHNPSLLSPL